MNWHYTLGIITTAMIVGILIYYLCFAEDRKDRDY